uniref:Putative methyltransferase n=1 Tax=viral metagenome TaxID=1070528 RepID=A0A6M3XTL1_9ZZZZ
MKHNSNCGICNGTDLVQVLDLGEMPLANAFITKAEFADEKKYPLRVYFCRTCKSVQLLDIIDPEIVFKKYEYLTSASKPLSDHFVKMGKDLCNDFNITAKDMVVEIGGNDGVLLDAIKDRCFVVNVEPARNPAQLSCEKGIKTIEEFFDSSLADDIWQLTGSAKLIVANNVMAHIENIRDTFKGVKIMLAEDGVFVFEVHWLGNLVGTGGFDQIYHEHIFYHSLTALKYLVESVGLHIFDVEKVPIHGQSLRVFVATDRQVRPTVQKLIFEERDLGLDREETFTAFQDKIFRNKKVLVEMCRMFRRERKSIVGYGAPAKGNTLLNYYQLPLDYIVDTTPGKQGLYTPGMHIEVSPPERLLKDTPDCILILAWNYADSILVKERDLIKQGVKFIIPVPEVRIV